VILIAGGRSKKNVYDTILPMLRNVKGVVLVGEASDEMEQAFAGVAPTHRAGASMEEAVAIARSLALPGDVVLLSPACASFDMFDNYEHRGDVFKRLVMELTPEENERVTL
jgi:UDP-N-acetylmuramoylalanine--D-glutamate ligase